MLGLFFLFLAISLPACSLPSLPSLPFFQAPATTTPEPLPDQTVDTLSLFVPAYATSLQPGESVPGTGLQYIGRAGDGYEVSQDGLGATKRTGDSFYWSGVLAPGVFANYNLRLTASIFGGLPVAGPVELIVLFPQPIEGLTVDGLDSKFHFGNLLLDYKVPPGGHVPGTTLVYEGVEYQGGSDQGNKLARFSGLSGYPYLAAGDSLVWSGSLRDNVMARFSLRTVTFDEERIHLVGTGDLWILN
ncbi:MAG: hypothetical protein R3293_10770 [Candidatus Promineifilaceae bacterium]|nr:hypothetical protein [Candidatus Promineifilaceae bacterium]